MRFPVRATSKAAFGAPEHAGDVGFYRIRGASGRTRDRIRQYAFAQLGKRFDSAFSLADDSRMYCTELVLKALAAGGIDAASTVPRIRVMLIAEPVALPDHLTRSPVAEPLARR